MNAEGLLVQYERIAEAPDAITRLRRFVLDLAVRGKLVPQDAGDEPVSLLLPRLTEVRRRRGGEAPQGVAAKAAPHELPLSWSWVFVGEAFEYDAGTKREPKDLDPERWLLELEDVEKDTGRLLARVRVSERPSLSTKSEFQPGDILYGKLRPYLNKVLVADEPGYSTTEIVAIRPYLPLCAAYCALAFRRPDFVTYVERLGRGTKMPRLRTPDAVAAVFPLPPIAEQRRIVAKVDELMALCDRLEAARTAREGTRDRLAAASLARLNTPDPETFPSDARFALDALPALTARPDQIKHLRQTILNLAVRGKLVPQDPSDEPAGERLARITAARQKLVAAGEVKQGKPDDEVAVPFRIPATWEWCTLGRFSRLITKGSSPKWQGVDYVDREKGLLFVTSENVGKFRLQKMEAPKYVEARFAEIEPRSMLQRGDILINLVGASIGRTAVYDLDEAANINQAVALVRMVNPALGPATDYLLLYLNSDAAVDRMLGSRVTTAQPNISLADVTGFPVPVPPFSEQVRIIARVDELMSLCDALEASLAAATTARTRLLDATLAEALAPAQDIAA